ncbi:hypothetical protein KR018_005413 [Drosophila ironensis]|nr:hypothetical protein KR018_005413 [Drosophila ironensis]
MCEEESAEEDPLANLLSLKLKKPAHWRWELSTSRSCTNIALPRILLYDHAGQLLVDATGPGEQTYRSVDASPRRRKRSATSNLSLEGNFHGLRIAEATPTPRTTPTRSSSGQQRSHGSCIDLNTHELPNWEPSSLSSRRSSSLRGVRFQEEEVPVYPTPPSTSTTLNSSSSGPREKRRYRRSHSSILERFSLSKGRHSSPEFVHEVETEVPKAPRYFLRTSKAGTLVIREESLSSNQRHRHRRRRPPKHSSSENILQEEPPEPVVQATTRRRPERRVSTSSEEEQQEQDRDQATRRCRGRARNQSQRSCGKDAAQDLITVDPDNCVYRAAPGATAR